jgi:hypothetical protein
LKELLEKSSGDEIKVSFNDTVTSVIFSSNNKSDLEIEITTIIDNANMEDVIDGKVTPMKVYIVEVGEYSDRHIVAVCSTENNAKEAEKLFNKTDESQCVEAFVIDAYKCIPKDHDIYKIDIDEKGQVLKVYKSSFESHLDEAIDQLRYIDTNGDMTLIVFAKNEGHAAKIANEFRAFVLASGLWKEGNTWKKGKLVQKEDID